MRTEHYIACCEQDKLLDGKGGDLSIIWGTWDTIEVMHVIVRKKKSLGMDWSRAPKGLHR